MTFEPTLEDPTPTKWTDAVGALKAWSIELNQRAEGHRRAAQRFRNLNRALGGLNVILAALTATAMFAALNKKLDNLPLIYQLSLTLMAALPSIAVGLQKEWQIVAREEGHVRLAYDCRLLMKEVEYMLAFPPQDLKQTIPEWHRRYREVICRPAVSVPR